MTAAEARSAVLDALRARGVRVEGAPPGRCVLLSVREPLEGGPLVLSAVPGMVPIELVGFLEALRKLLLCGGAEVV